MHDVSQRFKDAIKQSRTITSMAHLYRRDELIFPDIPIISGTITDDSTALVRRRVELTLPGTQDILDLLPSAVPDQGGLWPVGNELHVYTGIDFEDDTEAEYVHLGVFRVNRPKVVDSGGDVGISVQGYDRARTVQRNKFVTPYNIRAGINYVIAIRDLLMNRVPWLTEDDFNFMETDFTTPVLTFTHEDDPWEMATIMAASLGAQLYWDHHGKPTMRPEPDMSNTPPIWEYIEGEEAIITGVTRDLNDDDAYNGVVVSAENTSNSTPIRAEVWDTDPNSPTYYDPDNASESLYGANPKFITSNVVTTFDQALVMARAELRRELGIAEHIDFTSIVNPLHESNDVIGIRRERVSVDNVYVLESFKADIGFQGNMSGTTRRRRVTAA